MNAENVPTKLAKIKATNKEQENTKSDIERHKAECLNALIREQVIHVLGKPSNLIQVQVRPLWNSFFRVNVLTGPDVVSGKVANSYFVTADSDGKIIHSTPKISKQY
ncbi:MAG: hypothetical protein ACJ8FY_18390 [Gemmataceae bacterium]